MRHFIIKPNFMSKILEFIITNTPCPYISKMWSAFYCGVNIKPSIYEEFCSDLVNFGFI